MEIFWAIVLFAVGLFVVVKGADFFVDASSWVSDVTGISKVLIGATLVAIATSGPELFVSVIASVQGQVDMSIGNVVGSHIANLGLGFSLIAAFRPQKNREKLFAFNGIVMALTALLLLLFCLYGTLTIWFAVVLALVFIAFTFVNIKFAESPQLLAPMQTELAGAVPSEEAQEVAQADVVEESVAQESVAQEQEQAAISTQAAKRTTRVKKPTNKKEIIINVLKFVLGMAAIIFGSKLIVDKATVLATAMGVSEMFIGLTIVAVGTSLPEIVTTIAAIIKKEDDLGIGNIFGSCIFNNAFILAIAAFITGGIAFADSTFLDLIVAILLSVVAIIPTIWKKRIYRWQGILLLLGYFVYVGYLTFA